MINADLKNGLIDPKSKNMNLIDFREDLQENLEENFDLYSECLSGDLFLSGLLINTNTKNIPKMSKRFISLLQKTEVFESLTDNNDQELNLVISSFMNESNFNFNIFDDNQIYEHKFEFNKRNKIVEDFIPIQISFNNMILFTDIENEENYSQWKENLMDELDRIFSFKNTNWNDYVRIGDYIFHLIRENANKLVWNKNMINDNHRSIQTGTLNLKLSNNSFCENDKVGLFKFNLNFVIHINNGIC